MKTTEAIHLNRFERFFIENPWYRKNYARIRIRLGYVFAVILLLFAINPLCYWGVPVAVIGIALRAWAAGCILKNRSLSVQGPYALLQHPLYLGSFLIGLGIVITVFNLPLIILYIIVFGMLYHLTMLVEELCLLDLFGDEYLQYRRSTPRFFPRLSCLATASLTDWRFGQWRRNNEYQELLGYLGFMALLALRQHYIG